ncbi:MAG: M23 family metallopeptidase [Eubacteriales bacterium]
MVLALEKENLRRVRARLGGVRRFLHFHLRRIFSKTQLVLHGYHSTGPLTFLITASSIGLALVLSTLYTTSYVVTIDGVEMGVVENHQVVSRAIAQVEAQGKSILGEDYTVNNQVSYQFGLHLYSQLTDSSGIEHYLYSQLDDLGAHLLRYEVRLEGKSLGIIEKEEDLSQILDSILDEYRTENTISAVFVEDISLKEVYEGSFMDLDLLYDTLTENTTGETLYEVESGDTFNAIAFAHDMTSSDLQSLNPDQDPNRLFIGDILNIKEIIPRLSVVTVNHETYLEAIPCPVEEVNDNTIYIGSSKILVQGEEGEALVEANITFLNGKAVETEVISSLTIEEPTTTTKAIGTLERPKTASYGSFVWPTTGRISSYFGGRTLYGSYNYHSGLDIANSAGTTIVAADGGTVTFSGWRSSYGNLVIITHDNGWQTYYAHNTSNLVSTGQKVYRGQSIAKMGTTGNSTGNHLHFEVRINGTAVNPLGYLP